MKPQKRPTAAECLEHEWIQKHGFGRTQSLNKAQSKLVEYNASMHRKVRSRLVGCGFLVLVLVLLELLLLRVVARAVACATPSMSPWDQQKRVCKSC